MVRRPESTSGANIPTHYQPPPPPLPPVQRHEVHVTVTVAGDPSTITKLDLILAALGQIRTMEATEMATLADIQADAQANADAAAAVGGVITALLDKLAGAGTDAERQAIEDKIRASTDVLVAAALAGTPADPNPGGEPEPPIDEPV